MAARFQTKNQHGGRMTPSNAGSNSASTATTTSNTVPASPGTYNTSGESDQAFLDRIKVHETISDAFLQVARVKPDDPIDFLYNYFESQCQTKPYERAFTRLRLVDPKHPSFYSVLVELYGNFNQINEDVLLFKGDLYNKLLDSLCNSQPVFGTKEHRASLLALVSLRPNDPVSFDVFKYGIQAILLDKEFGKSIRNLYNFLAKSAGSTMEVDRSICETLVECLSESLSMTSKTPNDALTLHESVVKLSAHQLKQALENQRSSSRLSSSSSNRARVTIEDFENMAMPVFLKTIKKIP